MKNTEIHKENIRKIMKTEDEITFDEIETNPYESSKHLVKYNVGETHEARCCTDTNHVMHITTTENAENIIGQRKEVSELKQIALKTVEEAIPGFERILSTMHPLEANDRREIYYFRWEDLSEPLSKNILPPFVQIGLFPDGSISSFTDTLTPIITSKAMKIFTVKLTQHQYSEEEIEAKTEEEALKIAEEMYENDEWGGPTEIDHEFEIL